MINRDQSIQKSLFTYYLCVYGVYLLCTYINTRIYVYILKIFVCKHLYIIYIIYKYKYFIYKSNLFFLNIVLCT